MHLKSGEEYKKKGIKGMHIELFWIKAHAGHAGNERADQLAKEAAVKSKIKPIYDRCPISFVKKATLHRTVERKILK